MHAKQIPGRKKKIHTLSGRMSWSGYEPIPLGPRLNIMTIELSNNLYNIEIKKFKIK